MLKLERDRPDLYRDAAGDLAVGDLAAGDLAPGTTVRILATGDALSL